jgi:hypothetical protein
MFISLILVEFFFLSLSFANLSVLKWCKENLSTIDISDSTAGKKETPLSPENLEMIFTENVKNRQSLIVCCTNESKIFRMFDELIDNLEVKNQMFLEFNNLIRFERNADFRNFILNKVHQTINNKLLKEKGELIQQYEKAIKFSKKNYTIKKQDISPYLEDKVEVPEEWTLDITLDLIEKGTYFQLVTEDKELRKFLDFVAKKVASPSMLFYANGISCEKEMQFKKLEMAITSEPIQKEYQHAQKGEVIFQQIELNFSQQSINLESWIDRIAKAFNNFSPCFIPEYDLALNNDSILKGKARIQRDLDKEEVNVHTVLKHVNLIIYNQKNVKAVDLTSGILKQVVQHFERLEREKMEKRITAQRELEHKQALQHRDFKMKILGAIVCSFLVVLLIFGFLLLVTVKKSHKKQPNFY